MRRMCVLTLVSCVVLAVAGCTSPSDDGQATTTTTTTTYTVTYDGNGATSGSVPVDSTSYQSGQSVTVLGNTGTLAKTGSTYNGWNTKADGSGTTYTQGQTLAMGTTNVTLYAKWTTNPTYTVTYDGNGSTGGSVPADTTNYQSGQTVTVLANSGVLTLSAHAFGGWNTKADGTGTGYSAGGSFTMGGANVTLYAVWVVAYSVTYNGNGATGGSVPVDSTYYTAGKTVTVLGNTGSLTLSGYVFASWNTKADGTGTSYSAGGTFTMGSANVTLYAKWTPTYRVTYNGNGSTGGSVPVDSTNYLAGQTVTVLDNTGVLTLGGYTVVSWNTTAGGTGTTYKAGATFTMGSVNVTLYAQWDHCASSVSLGYHHTMVTKWDGTLWATGYNNKGQLGDGTTTTRNSFENISGGWGAVDSAAAGWTDTMILDTSGNVWWTGDNGFGEFGNGTLTSTYSPSGVVSSVAAVASGSVHTMILKTDHTLWATGANLWGQLGDGTTTNVTTFEKVMSGIAAVSAGQYHTMIIDTLGNLWATGYNNYGQLGDGTTTSRSTPVKVMSNVESVVAGENHTMIIDTSGNLWATGSNSSGELGDGTKTDKYSPVKVMSGVKSVAVGEAYTMILDTSGNLWATGFNSHGQLGDGTLTSKSTPVKVMSGVAAVYAGGWRTLILKTDNSLWATGYNGDGDLGDGTYMDKTTPVRVM